MRMSFSALLPKGCAPWGVPSPLGLVLCASSSLSAGGVCGGREARTDLLQEDGIEGHRHRGEHEWLRLPTLLSENGCLGLGCKSGGVGGIGRAFKSGRGRMDVSTAGLLLQLVAIFCCMGKIISGSYIWENAATEQALKIAGSGTHFGTSPGGSGCETQEGGRYEAIAFNLPKLRLRQ